jgi:aryl-alcohol dehydrogenase-like predicted oxidoreductase
MIWQQTDFHRDGAWMQCVEFPNTDLRVSALCLGTGSFGSDVPRDAAFELMDAYFEAGGNVLDTARVYADWLPGGANASERTLGEWLKQRGLRDQVYVSTKGAHPALATMHIPRMSPQEISYDISQSLHYLQTDRIDLYWLHRDAPDVPVSEIIDALNIHIRAGQIRCIGCSNWTAQRIREANDYAQGHNLAGFVANQPLWSLAAPNPGAISDKTLVLMGEDDLRFHHETGMAVMPYTSQAKGYFAKLESGSLKESDKRQYDSPLNRQRCQRAAELAARHGVSITTISLSYLTSQPFPTVPIIGPKTMAQLEDCLTNADLRLSPEELAYLENAR